MSHFASLFKKKIRTSIRKLNNDVQLEMAKGINLLGKRQEEHEVLKDGALLFQELIASCDGQVCHPIHMFSAKELIEAMKDGFDHGSESLFSRYWGTYQDRKIIIEIYKREHVNQFINEVVSLAQINHRNVVKLLGCCLEMQSPVVVYELLPNTLHKLLHTENPSDQISWEKLLRIAIEIADAVTYSHIAKPRPIIHRDIKSRNILLDEHCRPKLCGFYLSIAIPLGETHVEDVVCGTVGYLDPHYAATGIITEKVDVYGFGWVMLEILSRKTPRELAKFWSDLRMEQAIPIEVILERVKGLSLVSVANLPVDTRKIEQLMACVELAGRCIAHEPDQRPTMQEVALKLREIEKHQLPCSSSASSSSL